MLPEVKLKSDVRLPAVVLVSEASGGEPDSRDTGYMLAGPGAFAGTFIGAAGDW